VYAITKPDKKVWQTLALDAWEQRTLYALCLHLHLRISRIHTERFLLYRTKFTITQKNCHQVLYLVAVKNFIFLFE
jgi:hypothetical protein